MCPPLKRGRNTAIQDIWICWLARSGHDDRPQFATSQTDRGWTNFGGEFGPPTRVGVDDRGHERNLPICTGHIDLVHEAQATIAAGVIKMMTPWPLAAGWIAVTILAASVWATWCRLEASLVFSGGRLRGVQAAQRGAGYDVTLGSEIKPSPIPCGRGFEFRPRHLNPGVAKFRDPGVLFCADGEAGRVIPRNRKGLRRSPRSASLSSGVARPVVFTRASLRSPNSGPDSRPSLRLAPPGLRGVGFALSVATFRGWER